MYGKSNMETYITTEATQQQQQQITIYKIDSQWEFAVTSQGTQTGALYQPRGVG